jgi:hypothetical protein
MAMKEQMLRLECRLADMAERVSGAASNSGAAVPEKRQ